MPSQASSAASSCSIAGQVEVVGGFVEDEAVRPSCDEEGELGSGPFARGQRRRRAQRREMAEPELGEQRTRLGRRAWPVRRAPTKASSKTAHPSENRCRSWPSSPNTTEGPTQRSPASSGTAPSTAPRGWTSRCRWDRRWRVGRPIAPRGRGDRAASRPARSTAPDSRTTTSPLRRARARSRRSCQGSKGFSTGLETCQGLLGDPDLGGLLLAAVDPEVPLRLVAVLRVAPSLGDADSPPTGAGPLALAKPVPLGDVARVGLLGVSAGRGLGLEIGGEAPAVRRGAMRRLVDVDDRGDDPFEELPVVADDRPARLGVRRGTRSSRSRPSKSRSLVGSSRRRRS